MVRHTRRSVLATSGGLAAVLATGTTAAGTESSERFVVDTSNVGDGADVEVIHRLDPIDLTVVRGTESDVEALNVEYASDAGYSVEPPDVEKNAATVTAEESDLLYQFQWDKQDQQIRDAHEITRGEDTRIAIIDSGVAAGHPALEHAVNEELSRNFTEDDYGAPGPYAGSHGTHVAGIAAASDAGDGRVLGTAPEAELVDCRVFSPTRWPGLFGFLGDVLAAIVYSAENGADAANLSLGAYLRFRDDGIGRFWGEAMQRTATYANRSGMVLTHACGNWGGDLTKDQDFVDTSLSAGGLTVSATGPIGFMWGDDGLQEPFHSPSFYTNYGSSAVDLGAPGGDFADGGAAYDLVLNCIADPEYGDDGEYLGAEYDYGYFAGTSMAAPQVAGAAALVSSANPDHNADQVKNELQRAAEIPDDYDKKYYGSGYLDVFSALE